MSGDGDRSGGGARCGGGRLGPGAPPSPAFCPAALGPRDGAVWAAGRGRAAPRRAGRGRGASRRWQVGVTLGPGLAPTARSALREPRGAAALRSAQRPPGLVTGYRGAPSHQTSPAYGDRARPEPTRRISVAPQPQPWGERVPERVRCSPAQLHTESQCPSVRGSEQPRSPPNK